MTSRKRLSLIVLSLATLVLPSAYFAQSAPLKDAIAESAQRTIPAVPPQASHAHNICVRIVSVSPVEATGKTKLLKLEVERYYGKITTASLNRAKENETKRFTILFPASPDADVRPGDLINYWLVGYTPMRDGNVADNSGVESQQPNRNGG